MNNKRWDGSKRDDGINNRTYAMIFRDYYMPQKGIMETSEAYKAISSFTISPHKKNVVKSNGSVIKKKKDIGYEYQDEVDIIDFDVISNHVKHRKEKKELTSYRRYGLCHERSIELSKKIIGSKVITGYINFYGNNYLHSVVEIERNNEKYILDWTKNLIIKKDDYINLTHFRETSEIKRESLLDDYILLDGIDLPLKAYTLFRDEIVADLEKNTLIKRKV